MSGMPGPTITGPSGPITRPNSVTQSAESTALTMSHRPLSRKPPSTTVAPPVGRPELAITGSGSSPQIASTPAGSSNPAVTPRFPFHTFQATAPSRRPNASKTSSASGRLASNPPSSIGVCSRNAPAVFSTASNSGGRRRMRSPSSRQVMTASCTEATRSSGRMGSGRCETVNDVAVAAFVMCVIRSHLRRGSHPQYGRSPATVMRSITRRFGK